jgi:hypothetical protein
MNLNIFKFCGGCNPCVACDAARGHGHEDGIVNIKLEKPKNMMRWKDNIH